MHFLFIEEIGKIHAAFNYGQQSKSAPLPEQGMVTRLLCFVRAQAGPDDRAANRAKSSTMAFNFLHTADWQIGRGFGGMPRDLAAALAETRLSAIDRLAEAAIAGGARHILVAGDMFDSLTLSPRIVGQALARLARRGSLLWHVLPGNHDAHRPGGLWERLLADDPPTNLHLYLTPEAVEIEPGVWLLPAPLTARAASLDPTAHFDQCQTPPGAIRIGLAHGSVRGFGSDGQAPVTITADRVTSAGLDYLALGDWHGTKQINARAWYSGTPEPDRYLDNDPGHALLVQIETSGSLPLVERVRTAQFTWAAFEHHLAGAVSFAGLEAQIDKAAAKPSDLLLKLKLTGRFSAAERQALVKRMDRLKDSVRHLDLDLSQCSLRATQTDLEVLGEAGDLRAIGDRLAALGTPEAAGALVVLFDLVAACGGNES